MNRKKTNWKKLTHRSGCILLGATVGIWLSGTLLYGWGFLMGGICLGIDFDD